MKRPFIYALLSSLVISSGCLEMGPTYSKLPPGPWRGVLKLDPQKSVSEQVEKETRVSELLRFDEVTEGDLPFNFEVVYTDPDNFYLEISNDSERIRLDEITYLRDRATIKDTLIIPFPPFDSYFKVLFEDNILEGYWHVPSRGNYQVHFIAKHGQNHRFTTLRKKPMLDLTGKWEIYFSVEDSIPEPAIGEFVQKDNYLAGTFLTETGDYRYLEGTVQDNKMYLSSFDGSHMFLLEALINPDSTLSGIFRSGTHYLTSWTGHRNENFTLRSADSLTQLVSGDLNFTFPDENGKLISLHDAEFEGKPKIIQILGTWCPNCAEETRFLVDYLSSHQTDVSVIGLAFERHTQNDKAKRAIARFRDKLEVPYPILHAGPADKQAASKVLPQLNAVISYPTLIFLDRTNTVKRIHTGFSGSATSEYPQFIEKFEQTILSITAQENL